MRTRKEFFEKNPNELPANPEDRGEVIDQFIYSSDETICLSLEYASSLIEEPIKDEDSDEASDRRFLRCPAAVTVGLLKRLIRGKYGLDCNHALDILYGDAFLCDEYSLVDLAYIYNWRRKGPMRLKYRIYQKSEAPRSNGVDVLKADIKDEPSETKSSEELKKSNSELKEAEALLNEIVVTRVSDEDTNNGDDLKAISISSSLLNGTSNDEKKDLNIVSLATKLETVSTETLPSVNGSSNVASISPVASQTKDSSSGLKTLKVPPKTWSPSVNRLATKRPCSSSVGDSSNSPELNPTQAKRAVTSSPSKVSAPRFFKVRNASQAFNPSSGNATSASGPSIASVTESPVQEVAVNLSKISNSVKKLEKEKTQRDSSVSSTPVSIRLTTNTTSSRNTSSQKSIQSNTTSHKNEDVHKSRTTVNSPSSSSVAIPPTSSVSDSAQTLLPAWMNMARGLSHPRPNALPSSFPNHAALSANFLSNLFASHSQYPYLTPQMNMTLTPPGGSLTEGKKQSPNSASTTSPASSSSSLPPVLPLKPTSPRSPSGFSTPTFNLNALQSYSAGLSPLLPLSRDLVGSFYTSYVSRPFLPIRMSAALTKTSLTPSISSSSGGGYHSSLPPTVTSSTSSGASSSTSSLIKKSSGLRQIVPRRSAPPPPLVPIRSAPSMRLPPTLLPINQSDVEDKQPSTPKTSSSTPPASVTKCVVVESPVAKPIQESNKTNSEIDKMESSKSEKLEVTQVEKNVVEKEAGKSKVEKCVDPVDEKNKETSDNLLSTQDEEQKVQVQKTKDSSEQETETNASKPLEMVSSELLVNSEKVNCTGEESLLSNSKKPETVELPTAT